MRAVIVIESLGKLTEIKEFNSLDWARDYLYGIQNKKENPGTEYRLYIEDVGLVFSLTFESLEDRNGKP